METQKEMNFFDLCVVCGRAIGRGCAVCGRVLAHILRLSYRYWWLVGTLSVLGIAAGLYYTRQANRTYRVNAVALLNGPSIQQFEQAFAPLGAIQMIPEEAAIKPFLQQRQAFAFNTYRVVDSKHDGIADYIDFKRKSSPTDTLEIQMHDRLCLQFRIKDRNMALLPEIEQALLDFLNADEAMNKSYAAYLSNLRAEVAFNHEQALKLDSLTSAYYFFNASNAQPMNYKGNGVNFYGDRHIHLFLDEIYKHQKYMQLEDYRLQLATAPVSLENHFSVDPKPVNGRLKCTLLFFLIAWLGACLLAELIDKRKALNAWLKA